MQARSFVRSFVRLVGRVAGRRQKWATASESGESEAEEERVRAGS